ncbi:bifunctional murein DD-endopeptidase/murein LD-carboxypeptidase [Alkaliphilus pronyensis]|uniref:Bifunctional murein DD-endopeptidase/murein LD-carboxypeptidase n=1 Tax=Alkaliphilus pronyensis TaxID=1482732 RepID=A0A6I0F036_9FIRM|nr:NlpC/P60 family protein [Alkaliphilus pronyensis]KAB3535247.1 bifunctional murein DD-endopeptidase/murein LD-carboxypeptidase [Alkaliphilus pronyensis]
MNQLKKLKGIWLVLLILLTAVVPSYGYSNETEIQRILLAESLIGKPFTPEGNTPEEGFNSTGLIQYVFRQSENIVLPRQPSKLWKLGKTIKRSEIQPGDVLFFTGNNNLIPAIYKGDNIIIVVSTNDGVVKRNIVKDSYWRDNYIGARHYANIANELNPIAVKALELVESPYEIGGNNPKGFDYSGFVQYVFSEINKLDFPRTSTEQWRVGLEVDTSDLESGDVLFFQGSGVRLPGIYIDNGIFVIATTKGVAVVDLETSDYWKSRLLGARRFTKNIIEESVVSNPIVEKAMDLLETPYNPEGKSPAEGFNTTNFVRYVFKDILGIQLSVFSDRIYEIGEFISKQELKAGDLVFFQGSSLIPGIYKGNGMFIVQTVAEGAAVRDIESEYWSDIYVGAKRLTEKDIYYSQPENYMQHENLVIREAMKYIGTPYLLGGETIDGFDCSYLVQTVFRDAKNIYLPRISYKQAVVGETIEYEKKRPGDVIYFTGKFQQDGKTHHTAIYLGNNYIIHASGDEGMTTISYLGKYLLERYAVIKRFDSLSLRLDSRVVEEAYKTLGVGYVAGGNTIEGFDYSGFLQYVMKAGLDIELPRYSFQQWALGNEVERQDLNIGDVLFFESSDKVLLPGLYIGNEQFIVVTKYEGVAIRDLNISDSYWTQRYVGARRYKKIENNHPAVIKAKEYIDASFEDYTTAQFVQKVFNEASDIHLKLPAKAYEQWNLGQAISPDELEEGDLIFFKSHLTEDIPMMTGIYAGEGSFIILTSTGVKERNLRYNKYWSERYLGARQLP